VLRYDNEAGEGDRRHVGNQQFNYDFVGVDHLRRDFLLEARGWLGGTVTIDVRTLEEPLDGFSRAWKTGKLDPAPRISFVSYDLLHKVLAPSRMAIIRIMSGAGPLSIREVARRVGRDFKGVHSDVKALLLSGVIDKAADGKVVFPYDGIHFDFRISSAA
jgi:predicted transcriptional regulator